MFFSHLVKKSLFKTMRSYWLSVIFVFLEVLVFHHVCFFRASSQGKVDANSHYPYFTLFYTEKWHQGKIVTIPFVFLIFCFAWPLGDVGSRLRAYCLNGARLDSRTVNYRLRKQSHWDGLKNSTEKNSEGARM